MTKQMPELNRFMQVYDESADGIFRYCLFRIFDRELARDLTQEAFLRTWQQLALGRDIKNLRAFTYKVARNLIIDNSRKKKELSLETLISEASFDPGTADKSPDFVDGKLLLSSLNKLNEADREVIIMRYVEDLKPTEIAEILNESPNAISIRLNRAVNKLKEILDK